MTFQEKLAALKEKIESQIPQEHLNVMHNATQDLFDRNLLANVLKVGEKCPNFTLENQNGEKVNVKDMYKDKPLVITFYRGIWCPYCNLDLENLGEINPTIEKLGAKMITISPELHDYSKSIIKKEKLPYDIFYDFENETADKFGLRFELQEELKATYMKFGINLERFNGENSWTLPMPARFLIDTDGTIRYAEASPDYTKRPDPDALIEVLKTI